MTATLYQRSFPVAGAPVAVSFLPQNPAQRHTYEAGGAVYEAEFRELLVVVPDGAKFDERRQLVFRDEKGLLVRLSAQEVLDRCRAGAPGFGLA